MTPDNEELALRRLLEASECLDPHDPTTAALIAIAWALLAVADTIRAATNERSAP